MVISFARTRLKSTIRDQFVSHLGTDHFVFEGGGVIYVPKKPVQCVKKKKVRKDATFFIYAYKRGYHRVGMKLQLLFAFICNSHCRTV